MDRRYCDGARRVGELRRQASGRHCTRPGSATGPLRGAHLNAVWPHAVVLTCVVHLLRSAMRYASYTDRRAMVTAMRPIYTAPTEEAAVLAMEDFRTQWHTK